jgi:hypothetical protein
MPCFKARQEQEREEYVRANRRDVDRFAGVTDPVEIIKILYRPRPHDPLENLLPPPRPADTLWRELDGAQVQQLVEHAAGCAADGDLAQAEALTEQLVALTDARLDRILEEFVSLGHFDPVPAFRRAGASVRDALLKRVRKDAEHRADVLGALAWIGDDTVVDLFARWRREPPAWASSLDVPPEEHAAGAGWELTVDGTRRNLFHTVCHALVQGGDPARSPVRVGEQSGEPCRWCGRPLVALLTLDPAPDALRGLALPAATMRILTCGRCVAFGPLYARVVDPGPAWHPANTQPGSLPHPDEDGDEPYDLVGDRLVLAGAPCSPFRAVDDSHRLPGRDLRVSQVGGLPVWEQDPAYPRCPDCGEHMVFVGQVDGADLHSAGVLYAFVCYEDLVGATAYQCT